MRTLNRLDRPKSYALMKWMDGRRDHAEQATAVALASEAEKELGFHVTRGNIEGVRQDLGIVRKEPGGGPYASAEDVERLAATVENVEGFVSLLLRGDAIEKWLNERRPNLDKANPTTLAEALRGETGIRVSVSEMNKAMDCLPIGRREAFATFGHSGDVARLTNQVAALARAVASIVESRPDEARMLIANMPRLLTGDPGPEAGG